MTKVEQAVEVLMKWEKSEISIEELKVRMRKIGPSWPEIDEAEQIVSKRIGENDRRGQS